LKSQVGNWGTWHRHVCLFLFFLIFKFYFIHMCCLFLYAIIFIQLILLTLVSSLWVLTKYIPPSFPLLNFCMHLCSQILYHSIFFPHNFSLSRTS
jgi:hypothetical protein